MNASQAKQILSSYRPSGQHVHDAEFTEAVVAARSNPELARWFAELQAFDAIMTSALGRVPVPPDLKESILAQARSARSAPVVRLPWWHWRAPIPVSAVAATFVLLAVVTALWLYQKTDQFADFRDELIQQGLENEPHVEVQTSDLLQIRAWLNGRGANGDFALPRGLNDLKPVGCATLEWKGSKVAFVCFGNVLHHYHLYVVEQNTLHHPPPEDQPYFEDSGAWKTVSWSHHGKTYLFSGMSNFSFVRRIREAGQWHWSS